MVLAPWPVRFLLLEPPTRPDDRRIIF